jgi:hypothetical protein
MTPLLLSRGSSLANCFDPIASRENARLQNLSLEFVGEVSWVVSTNLEGDLLAREPTPVVEKANRILDEQLVAFYNPPWSFV